VQETKRQIESMFFEMLALSKDKNGILELSRKGQLNNHSGCFLMTSYFFLMEG
jgi:predicted nuclease of restriction endonuclease-like (RecB) superfamily